ncbi:MAG: hypothetical protein ACI9T7_001333 [Oleiphilaceae bacterium]|jgi:hypothetical protein
MNELQRIEELQKNENLQLALLEVDQIVFKGCLDQIEQFSLLPVDCDFEDAVTNIRLNKLTRIVYDKNENNLDKLVNAFASLHSCNSSLVIILKGQKQYTDIYIGTNKIDSSNGMSGGDAGETLKAALQGNFQGIEFGEPLFNSDIESLLNPIESENNSHIASVLGVPSLKSENNEGFSQGIEKIIEGMKNRTYTAVIQATPVSRLELEVMEIAYQEIYSTLSVFEQKQLTLSVNDSIALGKSISEGVTKTLSKSAGQTLTSTNGTSSSATHSDSKTRSDWDIKKAFSMAASGAASGAIGAGAVSGGLGAPAGAAIGAAIGLGSGLLGGSQTSSDSSTLSENNSESDAYTTNESYSTANSSTQTDSETSTTGNSRSIQVTEKNKVVQSLLESIDQQLKRIQECKSYGMWSWGAYFIGESQLDVNLGADLYSGILRGESSGLERNAISTWSRREDANKFTEIAKYIAQLKHPVFETPAYFRTKQLSTTSLISTKEVALAMGLPQKSLPGIPVFESVEFGRAVTTYRNSAITDKIEIGSIFNLGSIDEHLKVNLDVDSLTSHTFVTGSTGSGKSNAIYSMLNSLWSQKKIPFLIVEPAKGEYKDVFGGNKDVNVFGTNPNISPLLKINPFSFPADIHITEHIDRLIEILNAVWPMYSAMPAILKEAVELTYENLGWDLLSSQNSYEPAVFPDFQDLLDELPKVIAKSEYSEEVKSNYAGALLTRVRSMTNGYFKTIFQKQELAASELFDKPCIVDLSRVGSSETKSTLMGMVFLKLQEYRMSSNLGSNSKLKHITVLEEAHHLLRRTSSEQSQEGANLQGKSVEMISNAIAEMRTYGEGFIIADQAPGLLDPSVIRNTNTKIILRLPDWEDRNLVGRAINLNEEQIEELARLRTGCAAIYQNDWQEAVLCQWDFFTESNHKRFVVSKETNLVNIDLRLKCKTELVKVMLNGYLRGDTAEQVKLAIEQDHSSCAFYYPNIYFNLNRSFSVLTEMANILNLKTLLDNIPSHDIDIWTETLKVKMFKSLDLSQFDENEKCSLLKMVLDILVVEKPCNKDVFEIQKEKMSYLHEVIL